ncbi:MAG TPA: NADH-quinone oxidoreductase subunit NuoF [Dehalococcoidia bacterium]|nr:NADH-quinone oxidoreductase subunit NuoF [Dehalococcoidia bacterium]
MDPAAITSTYGELRENALTRWNELWNSGSPVILVGAATCGRAAGALEVEDALRQEVRKRGLECPVIEVGCMGHCYAEPLVVISKQGNPPVCYGQVNPVVAEKLVRDYLIGDDPCLEFVLGAMESNDLIPSFDDFPRAAYEQKILLENCGRIDPEDIDHYVAINGYSALATVLTGEPDKVIEEIKQSGLRGRGGAGFSTGQKWETCRKSKGRTKYIICNGDEGDPGAFMDRDILESDPHSVIEGMIIAGYAVGARNGYIYVRAEYPLAVHRVEIAIRQARKKGLLGRNILQSGYSFDIKVFHGSGAYVCGEESALITSMEGHAGMPRHRPPYPATNGLNGKPTVINNVKTLAFVRHIVSKGVEWFRSIGSDQSKGTAVFALAGDIVNTGLVEVPMGTPLRNVIYDVGSGVPGGRKFKAVQIGGPSGGCLPESVLDLPVDFDSLSEAGAMMGSGGMVVLGEDKCMVEIARYLLEFTQRESCGKCTFCRLGTKQMLGILDRITKGQGEPEDIEMLDDLARDVKTGSLCNLGKTAPNPVLTTLRYFLDEYEAHINEKRCPSLMCPELIAFYILRDKCERSCDACIGTCTVEAISPDKSRIKVIDQEKCVKCGTCVTSCPPQYNAIIKVSPPSKVEEYEKNR